MTRRPHSKQQEARRAQWRQRHADGVGRGNTAGSFTDWQDQLRSAPEQPIAKFLEERDKRLEKPKLKPRTIGARKDPAKLFRRALDEAKVMTLTFLCQELL